MKPSTPAPVATVDEQNPWLGLVSFTEETKGYFHGREEEVGELSRRVQRKLLTILFGQSGLGKTSILQAGLVPRLRPEGFCPVYVRLDYAPGSPSPSEQIKRAVFQATQAAGNWTQVGSSITGETLWEFLHHRDDVLKDASGRILTPILIFDQFEEIFTLAQSDDAGRRRAQEFLADLADLVENRPPASLEARIDRDEADAARFDFARADYRILISLREDYLAHLEGLKGQMPSVTQNRMRLARMSGPQAVAAVCAPAPHLVTETVAEAIVRFVAGGADLARAEVEPSLLSLICRELNNARLAKGHAEISADLLAGSRETILSEFYERALADQPEGVRVFIEDEMLTDSGFRESVAEERVRKAFAAAGAPPEALAVLVNRRLLRVEDRLDLRRVEITHDVLCSVVAASRGVRREREALEESRRQLEAQKAREETTRRSLVRARAIAAVSAALMLVAAGSAVFGWINLRRAREAEARTQAAQRLADEARSESEKLVGFLLDEFYEELQPTGRVEIVEKLADRAVAYYEKLPPELVTNETNLYYGMALVRKAGAMGTEGDAAGCIRVSRQAARIFEELRAKGDTGETTSLGLALAKFTECTSTPGLWNAEILGQAADLLRPFVASGHASRATKLALGDVLNFYSHVTTPSEGIAACEEGRKVLAGLGALDLSDLTAASVYGDVTDSQAREEESAGRPEEGTRLEHVVVDLAQKILVKRPGDLRAMMDVYFGEEELAQLAEEDEDNVAAESDFHEALKAARTYKQFNPTDNEGWEFEFQSLSRLGTVLVEEGRVAEAMQVLKEVLPMGAGDPEKADSIGEYYFTLRKISLLDAELGNLAEADEMAARTARAGDGFVKTFPADKELLLSAMRNDEELLKWDMLASQGDYGAIYSHAAGTMAELATNSAKARKGTVVQLFLSGMVRDARALSTEASLRTGHFTEAESQSRQFLKDPMNSRMGPAALANQEARTKVRLGRALLGLGRKTEAREAIGGAMSRYHDRRSNGANGTTFRQEYAGALYQLALAQEEDGAGRAVRRSLLDQASGVLFGLSSEAQELVTSRELSQWVAAARAQDAAPGS